jgi:hypothetical protein
MKIILHKLTFIKNKIPMKKPGSGESASYYKYYIGLNTDTNVIENLSLQISSLKKLFLSVPEAQQTFRYAKGKWSVKELLGHLIDAERIFGYRALRIARRDRTPLAGFEEDYYVKYGYFDSRSMSSLLAEFVALRNANIELFKSLDEKRLALKGTANNSPVSVRALAYIISGHTIHHLNILKERYISAIKKKV